MQWFMNAVAPTEKRRIAVTSTANYKIRYVSKGQKFQAGY
jgi:hypothetical protein